MPRENVISMPSRRAVHVRKIKAAMGKSVEGFIETGRALATARDDLEHGEWMAMVRDDLKMHIRTVDMLMAIADHPQIGTNSSNLPPSWRTLYEITRLPERTIRARLDNGSLNPNTTQHEVITWQRMLAGRRQTQREAANTVDHDDDTVGNTPQDLWHFQLATAASQAAASAHFRAANWARFTPNQQLLSLARDAAESWKRVAEYLERRLRDAD